MHRRLPADVLKALSPRPAACRAAMALLAALAAVSRSPAADPGLDLFEKKIRPVLVQHCYECHSAKSRIVQGNLRLDSRDGIRKGGDSGPAVVPHKADESLLIDALKYAGLEMPPKGRLPDAVIADFVKWIERGAPDPREATPVTSGDAPRYTSIAEGRTFWAFQPPRRHPVPAVSDAAWPKTDIDRFLLAKMEAAGLKPARDADPATLIRRVSFDLVGLPPSPEQIADYLRDPTPERFARWVDELLASPQFGERWGRHWLDVARFAESTGGGRSMILPDAWRYRDYVIRAVNDDKPYDRFLVEQIAGDLLPFDTTAQRHDQLVATAFLAIGPTNYECQDKDILEMDVIDEQLDTIGRVVLGMTIGCARCHDHKFDPIPTRDYYALAGILKSTQTLVHDNVSKWVEVPLPMSPSQQADWDRHAAAVGSLQKRIAATKEAARAKTGETGLAKGPLKAADLPGIVLDDRQAKQVGPWVRSTFSGNYIGDGYLYDDRSKGGEKTLTFVPEFDAEGRYEVRLAYVPHENRAEKVPVTILHSDGETTVSVNQKQPPPIDGRFVSLGTYRYDTNGQWFVLVSNAGTTGHISIDALQLLSDRDVPADPAIAEIPPGTSPPDPAEVLRELEADLRKLLQNPPERPTTMGVKDAAAIGDTHICIRGNRTNRGDVVPRGFLRVTFPADAGTAIPAELQIPENESGRIQLARWLASRENPLTARVMVNRVWSHLFGTGLVRTPDIFGVTGEPPSHPELLDWLAVEFQGPEAGGQGPRPMPPASSPSEHPQSEIRSLRPPAWSVKSLIRQIVLSRAYQVSSRPDASPQAADPENRLLSRQNRRRLEAEAIRDAILVVSGRLDPKVGGPNLIVGPGGEYGYQFADTRRSVYTPVLRNRLHELFEVFDVADPNLVTGRRNQSTVATQALYMLNSPFVMAEAGYAARRLLAEPHADDAARLDRLYRLALGRSPTAGERSAALEFVASADDDKGGREAAWSRVVQAVLASVDFRYAP